MWLVDLLQTRKSEVTKTTTSPGLFFDLILILFAVVVCSVSLSLSLFFSPFFKGGRGALVPSEVKGAFAKKEGSLFRPFMPLRGTSRLRTDELEVARARQKKQKNKKIIKKKGVILWKKTPKVMDEIWLRDEQKLLNYLGILVIVLVVISEIMYATIPSYFSVGYFDICQSAFVISALVVTTTKFVCDRTIASQRKRERTVSYLLSLSSLAFV